MPSQTPLCYVKTIQPVQLTGATLRSKQQCGSYQLLQRGELLWKVTQSRPVQFEPSQATHAFDMLGEISSLKVTEDRK